MSVCPVPSRLPKKALKHKISLNKVVRYTSRITKSALAHLGCVREVSTYFLVIVSLKKKIDSSEPFCKLLFQQTFSIVQSWLFLGFHN